MEFYDYDNLESQESTCGQLKEGFTKDVGFARATLEKGISTAHYHKKTIEHYMIVEGSGELRVKLPSGEVESVNLKPGVVVKILPNEIHQAKTETGFTVEAITYPAWKAVDELDSEVNLFKA
jgi:mannose-6-phosphate isomerase-like protein (cupin superfamily)